MPQSPLLPATTTTTTPPHPNPLSAGIVALYIVQVLCCASNVIVSALNSYGFHAHIISSRASEVEPLKFVLGPAGRIDFNLQHYPDQDINVNKDSANLVDATRTIFEYSLLPYLSSKRVLMSLLVPQLTSRTSYTHLMCRHYCHSFLNDKY